MDPVSAAASALTIVGAITTTVQFAVEFKNSPKELQQLHSELDHLAGVAGVLNAVTVRQPQLDASVLHHPLRKLQNVQRSFGERFRRKGKSHTSFKHSAHRNQIKRLAKDIAAIRNDFNAAIGLLTLISLTSENVSGHYKLELSSMFSPENYTTWGPLIEPVLVYSILELHRTANFRMHKYCVLFAQHLRHWRRVVVHSTILTTASSDVVLEGTCRPEHRIRALGTLLPVLRTALSSVEDRFSDSVTDIQFTFALNSSSVRLLPSSPKVPVTPNAAGSVEDKGCVADIRRRGLTVYFENDITTIEYLQKAWYLARIGTQCFIERRAPFEDTESALKPSRQWQDIQQLLTAQGCHYVAKFGGVILDSTGNSFTGYLVHLPHRGTLGQALTAATEAKFVISNELKEKWIRQLVIAVADIHRRGVVVGDFSLRDLWLDGKDDLLVVDFQSSLGGCRRNPGQTPPEFRKKPTEQSPGARGSDHILTFASDIFMLGLAVWQIMEQLPESLGVFCRRSPCTSLYQYRCTAPHSDPIQLPPLPEQAPQYIKYIISDCRRSDPLDRPSAADILHELSTHSPPETCLAAHMMPLKFHISDIPEHKTYCDECGGTCATELYRCAFCADCDFDLCQKCFSNGVRCWSEKHAMYRSTLKNGEWLLDNMKNLGNVQASAPEHGPS